MKLTTANVCKLLTEAGHQRCWSYWTGKDWSEWSPTGFRCSDPPKGVGCMRVEHQTPFRSGKKSELMPYTATLKQYFDVTFIPQSVDEGYLLVTVKSDAEARDACERRGEDLE